MKVKIIVIIPQVQLIFIVIEMMFRGVHNFLKPGHFGIQEKNIFSFKVYFHLSAMKFNK